MQNHRLSFRSSESHRICTLAQSPGDSHMHIEVLETSSLPDSPSFLISDCFICQKPHLGDSELLHNLCAHFKIS